MTDRVYMTAAEAAALLIEPELKSSEARLRAFGDARVYVDLGPDTLRIYLAETNRCVVTVHRKGALS